MTSTITPEARPGASSNHTAAEPEAARSDGRDPRGRFARGNPGGPGNPFAAAVARLRRAALAAVSAQEMQSIFHVLALRAQSGHIPAMKLLFAYTIGLPTVTVDPDEVEESEPEVKGGEPALSPGAQAVLQALIAAAAEEAAKRTDKTGSVKPVGDAAGNGQTKRATPTPAAAAPDAAVAGAQGAPRVEEEKPRREAPVAPALPPGAPSTNGGDGGGGTAKADGERPGPQGRHEVPSTNGGDGAGAPPRTCGGEPF